MGTIPEHRRIVGQQNRSGYGTTPERNAAKTDVLEQSAQMHVRMAPVRGINERARGGRRPQDRV